MAHDMNRRIFEDDEARPQLTRVSQNVAVAAALLRGLLGPTTPKDHRAHREIHMLLEHAAVQQAESSLSRQRELDASQHTPLEQPNMDVSVHQA